MYADDTKISGTLKSETYQEDIIKFQSDIEKVTEWTEIWKMELNQKKMQGNAFWEK